MNRKQFAILVVLLVVLGGAGLLLRNKQKQESGAGEQGAGEKVLGDKFSVNDVTQISIKGGTNTLTLVKKDVWQVHERDDYPANFPQITEDLLKLANLKAAQVEEIGASQLGRMQLMPPGPGTNTGTSIELKDKDGKVMKSLLLGKKHMNKPQRTTPSPFGGDEGFPDGRYLMVGSSSKSAILVNDALEKLEPKPSEWLKKDFFHVERPKAVAVTFPVETNSWKIVRDTESGEWKLADAKGDEKLDNGKASGVSNPFSSPSFNDVVSQSAKPEDNGLDKPTVVTIDTFDDFTYTVKVGRKTGDEYPVTIAVAANFPKERTPAKDEKPEDKDKADKAWKDRQKQLEDKLKETKFYEKWTYLMPGWNVDPILKERKDLLPEKKDEKKEEKTADASAPAAIPAQPLTSDVIKVPSADELKNGAKIETLKPADVEKEKAKEEQKPQ